MHSQQGRHHLKGGENWFLEVPEIFDMICGSDPSKLNPIQH